MFGSGILDVAIGIVFVYLFLSLICSAVTELISRVKSLRAKNLEAGICKLLSDPNGNGIARKFYDHPLIQGITRDGHTPSYIPSRFFSIALLDIIAPVDAERGSKSIDEIRKSINKIENANIKRTLLVLLDDAGDDLNKAHRNIEKWFDEAMDRVSGWYKKRTQIFNITFAVLVTLALNVDTFYITKTLYRDNTLRNGLVAAAQEVVKDGNSNAAEVVQKINSDMTILKVPIGWPDSSLCNAKNSNISWYGLYCLILKVFGWVVTAVAISLGAPFWFDMLSKLVNIRSAGKQPEKANSEEEKDE